VRIQRFGVTEEEVEEEGMKLPDTIEIILGSPHSSDHEGMSSSSKSPTPRQEGQPK
jgi:hypothetical protein